jgi:hypothetical protein
MMLTAEERTKFIEWLDSEIKSHDGLIEAFEKCSDPMITGGS